MSAEKSRAEGFFPIIRFMVGSVFLSEGIQKFLFPAEVGAARFQKIGLPEPEFLASLVGGTEIVCGILILTGWQTRMATLPLLAIMFTALWTTKMPILMEKGFWKMAHEARTDYAMTLGLLFLLLSGSGLTSVDGWIATRNITKD